jgi:biopolymer transport protein ExbD
MALRKKHRDAEVSTDSLNDIMFFLLLFFLILSTMVSPNSIKVNLPKSDPTPVVNNNNKPIHIAVTKDKKYFVNNVELPFESVEAEISRFASTSTDPTVLMHLDKELSIQDEIDIMTICYRLKCKTVLATAANEK